MFVGRIGHSICVGMVLNAINSQVSRHSGKSDILHLRPCKQTEQFYSSIESVLGCVL